MKIKALSVMIAMAISMPALAASDEDRIAELETKVNQLESQAEANSWVDRFHINGFANLAVGGADNDLGYLGYTDDKPRFSNESLVAIQTTFDVNDKMAATIQLLSRGEKDWKPEIEWAFVSYQFDSGNKLRAGKLRLPFFMLSDYLDVGYAHPFLRPPEEVYGNVPISTFVGIDYVGTLQFEESSLSIQPLYGESNAKPEDSELITTDTSFEHALGAALTYEWDSLTLRGNYMQADVVSDALIALDGQDTQTGRFMGLGARYDVGTWSLMGEYTRVEVDGKSPDTDSAYLVGTYNIDEFTPYLMVAWAQTQDDDLREIPVPGVTSASNFQRTTWSGGLRWDFMSNVAAKFDVTYTGSFDGSTGGFNSNSTLVTDGPLTGVWITDQQESSGVVYSAMLNVVF